MDLLAALSPLLGVLTLITVLRATCSAIERGDLPRQSLVGLRTRATQASDEAWEAGHRAALPALRASIASGYVTLALSAVGAVFFLTVGQNLSPNYLLIVTLSGLFVPAVVLMRAARVADRAARKIINHHRPDSPSLFPEPPSSRS
ncbi:MULTISPECIES: SdpI family protein [unclassified Corynebacterium]|uniref:SdpI family protein n=1 Tax=unclassified Corynebacterium TaxID=2624378 RepID=UPI0029CA6483|nr:MULTISPECIES: SdpI family protein [unclassified Corynebacterium]WPF65228.1 SdpI family protein [Corynebacterium sp. 22KM0430]WPF67723.1 SdpI family protein [Corynebacterium sp. 21KM1197]